MKPKRLKFFLTALFLVFSFVCLSSPGVLFAADPSSTNYQIMEGFFSSGIGNATSANYKIDEGSIDSFSRAAGSSTNYAVQGKIGISGAERVAVLQSISPTNYSKIFSDESTAFTVTAVSLDSDTLEYRVKQDGVTKDGSQVSPALTWALSGSDLGRRSLLFEVIDPQGTVTQTQSMYVFRRPTK
jgi:hypothetical protein